MAANNQIKNLIQKADNHALRTVLMSSVSAITLSACMGGGGGGTFGIYGSSSSGARLDMASRLVKGTVVGARVFQDVDGDGVFDDDGTENFAFTDSSGAYSLELNNLTSNITPAFENKFLTSSNDTFSAIFIQHCNAYVHISETSPLYGWIVAMVTRLWQLQFMSQHGERKVATFEVSIWLFAL